MTRRQVSVRIQSSKVLTGEVARLMFLDLTDEDQMDLVNRWLAEDMKRIMAARAADMARANEAYVDRFYINTKGEA
jgi:hypothetical protein